MLLAQVSCFIRTEEVEHHHYSGTLQLVLHSLQGGQCWITTKLIFACSGFNYQSSSLGSVEGGCFKVAAYQTWKETWEREWHWFTQEANAMASVETPKARPGEYRVLRVVPVPFCAPGPGSAGEAASTLAASTATVVCPRSSPGRIQHLPPGLWLKGTTGAHCPTRATRSWLPGAAPSTWNEPPASQVTLFMITSRRCNLKKAQVDISS